jgi:hypothetical protein
VGLHFDIYIEKTVDLVDKGCYIETAGITKGPSDLQVLYNIIYI